MTPKEKAKEIFQKFWNIEGVYDLEFAIQCSLIAVDEILSNAAMIWGGRNTEIGLTARDEFRKYWYEVKNELEKL